MATADLWIQQKVARGDPQVTIIDGASNPADAFTKHLDTDDLLGKLRRVGWVTAAPES